MKEDNTTEQDLTDDDWPSEEDYKGMRSIPPLRTWRTFIGLSEDEFCSKFGVSMETLRDWETGCKKIDDWAIIDEVTELYLMASDRYFAKLKGFDIDSHTVTQDDAMAAINDSGAIERGLGREPGIAGHFELIGNGIIYMLVVSYARCHGKIKIISA